ncbi:MAG: multifunctional CCA tRNA nucleotidyl transferase/2'3'-cyclic phosphodiesterase/2'nucleotidase/phosphatase [Legionella sp.]|nr:multifunctional CCA tRNA nucleotidyl transferase/2'3'-cyclic phosphodiesterase/2'nucleotidase/phosphatase [Legionella sp.]
MKIYLVGGAVRDALLNEPVHEQDWVVVGATPDMLLKQGYQQVGRDFPVFLHPKTKEEYALARTERKSGAGYYGFACDANPNITLEEDLLRRDLTINAIAKDEAGNLIDPYHGVDDIKHKILKHVSEAFMEDPVRVLRLARFAARFYALGFRVADETAVLVKQMLKAGELKHLVPERVWQEWDKSLVSSHPEIFMKSLQDLGIFGEIFPLLDTENHQAMLEKLVAVAARSDNALIRFSAFMSGIQDKNKIKKFCETLRVPNAYKDLAVLAVVFNQAAYHDAKQIVSALERVDAFRKPERFKDLLIVCEARSDMRKKWQNAREACNMVDVSALVAKGHQGEAMKKALYDSRVSAVQAIL